VEQPRRCPDALRRYVARDVRDRFVAAGLAITRLSYAMTCCTARVGHAARRRLKSKRDASGPDAPPKASLVAVPAW
jgi:hypothetical protein